MSNVTILPSLPEDILAEILPRVSSVKSLLRFKCLSKSWYNFISSEKFAKKHLKNSVTNTTPDAICILPSPLDHNKSVVTHCPLDALFSEQGISDHDHDLVPYVLCDSYGYYLSSSRVIGCSNGLCCILVPGHAFVLLNPTTRQVYRLPLAFGTLYPTIIGFGYDESNNDYKVLVHINNSNRLYSLKTNSWKTVDNFMDSLVYRRFNAIGVFVNGKLHWLVGTDNTIVSFDLGSEATGVVQQPNDENGYNNYTVGLLTVDVSIYTTMLGVIEGYLCVFRGYCGESTDVWAMKEYGVKQSWYKMLTVPDLVGTLYLANYDPHYPVYISEVGDVLVAHKSSYFVYNLKTKSRRPLKINNSWRFDIGTCIQSLVSPFPPVNERMEDAELTG